MEKFQNQITFIYNGHVIDSVDDIDMTKFPIPHKKDTLSISKFNGETEPYKLYIVDSVEYAYKHFYTPENVITYIKIYLI